MPSFFDPTLFHTFSFVAIVIASVAGSLHCVGMCGGLVILAGSSSRGPLLGQLAYHLGRGCGYVALGILAGAFGDACMEAVRSLLTPHSSKGPFIALSIVISVCLAIYCLLNGKRNSLVAISSPSVISKIQQRMKGIPFTLGIITAILPCPWLYSFVLLAAAAGDAVLGAKVMTAFWLGTLPALLVVGTIFEATLRRLLKRYPCIAIVSVIVAFVLSISARLLHNHTSHGASPQQHHEQAHD